MDWFNQLGVYSRLIPQAPALAFDLATTPGLDGELDGYNIGYHMQSAPEVIEPYPNGG
jgi:hypothetical protein